MNFRYAVTGLAMVIALAGCQRTSYSGLNPSDSLPPLQAQPVPSVQSGQLAPPGAPADPNQFPAAPAAATPSMTDAAAPATALDISKEQLVGNWRVTNAGASCDMFLTLTNLGSGSRGGTRGCAGVLSTMGSWEVATKQVVLKNRSGDVIGRLYKTADARFDGTTNDGQALSLSR